MKHALAILLVGFLLAVCCSWCGPVQSAARLEERAATAARILHGTYALTASQTLRIVYMNSSVGNVCTEYVVDDARKQSFVKYAVFEKSSRFLNYDLDQDDIDDRCSTAGVDLTNVAEKELKDLAMPSVD